MLWTWGMTWEPEVIWINLCTAQRTSLSPERSHLPVSPVSTSHGRKFSARLLLPLCFSSYRSRGWAWVWLGHRRLIPPCWAEWSRLPWCGHTWRRVSHNRWTPQPGGQRRWRRPVTSPLQSGCASLWRQYRCRRPQSPGRRPQVQPVKPGSQPSPWRSYPSRRVPAMVRHHRRSDR